MREKLIELLDDIQMRGEDFTEYEIYGMNLPNTVSNEAVADYLITHGVTIPVRCTGCKYNDDCIRRIQFWGRNPVLELNTSEYHPLDFCSYGK